MANNYYNSKFEDTIQCSFYSVSPIELDALCEDLNKTVADLSKDYIWHRDKFSIYVSGLNTEEKDAPPHLMSTTCFGDNNEDEWFIVYLVVQITRIYPELVVKIEDNDGDFLLIEAADFLPSWANPDTTKNRVFIYQSNLHIISPKVFCLHSNLVLQDAINLVIQKTDETKANIEIQDAIRKRILSYPQKIKESQHRAYVTLPLDIATLLTLKPFLISPIVTTFCNHDMLDVKCLNNVNFDHCVTIPILFTKYLYAMLVHSKLPQISKFCRSSQNNKEIDLGRKLTYGYEMIMKKSSNDVFSSSEYSKFIQNLTKNGYFRGNIEGSSEHNKLLKEARDYFYNLECPLSSFFCNNVTQLMSSEEYKKVKHVLNKKDTVSQVAADDTEWLNINPDELNTFLNTRYGKKIAQNHASTAHQLEHFLKQTSDVEGIEQVNKEESDKNQIQFDSDQFVGSIEKMLNLISGKHNEEDCESDFSVEGDDSVYVEDNLEKELASKLQSCDKTNFRDENIIRNLLLSIQEEGISGPSSNLLKNIDVSKIELLDSDDD